MAERVAVRSAGVTSPAARPTWWFFGARLVVDEAGRVVADIETIVHPPIERMSRDLSTALQLLPAPSDGPFARLKDTLTAS
jgi:hypothetical protein